MSTRLPTKAEWEAAGFKVPAELCHDERELTDHQIMQALCRGESDPVSDLATEIVDALDQSIRGMGNIWEDLENTKIVEELIREFLMRTVNEKERRNDQQQSQTGNS